MSCFLQVHRSSKLKKTIKNQKDRIPRSTKNKMNQNLWMLLKMKLAAKSINPSSNHRKAARKLPPSKSPLTKAGSFLQKLLAIRNIRRLRELLKVRIRLKNWKNKNKNKSRNNYRRNNQRNNRSKNNLMNRKMNQNKSILRMNLRMMMILIDII